MNAILKSVFAVSAMVLAAQASAQATFYEHDNFNGRSYTARQPVDNVQRMGMNDRASSVVVEDSPWEVCSDSNFRGRCLILRPGSYGSLRAMGMNDKVSSAREVRRDVQYRPDRYAPQPLPGQITLFEHDGFQGRAINAKDSVGNLQGSGFNDRASSAVVLGNRWVACEDANFNGRCVVLRPGRYASLREMGLNDRLSSVRELKPNDRFDDDRYVSQPAPAYDWRRRPQERLHEAPITSVRAVFAEPQQKCWVEREQVVRDRRDPNVGGAVIGGLIGGILGHQVGSGSGRNVATVGGAVAGAVIGANVNQGGGQVVSTRDVQRCRATPAQGQPQYWDVVYNFRGTEHHVQSTTPPGHTITVNDRGEPRV